MSQLCLLFILGHNTHLNWLLCMWVNMSTRKYFGWQHFILHTQAWSINYDLNIWKKLCFWSCILRMLPG